MDFVTLRRAGGSLTLTIPRALVRALGLIEGGRIGVSVSDGKLVAEPVEASRPRYALEDLLAACDPGAPLTAEDEAWLGDRPMGSELL